MFFMDKDGMPPDLRKGPVFFRGFLMAAFGIGAAYLLFPAEASMIGVFLVALGQARTVHTMLDRNRDAVWQKGQPAWPANVQLATSLMMLFVGVFLSYAIVTFVVPADRVAAIFSRQVGGFGGRSLTEVQFDDLGAVLGHNMVVMLVGFLFAILYRHGGMVLVLAWNASVWGVVFAWIARSAPDTGAGGEILYFLKSMIAILPHLLLESVAYILVAIAGVFLSKNMAIYKWGSSHFSRGLRDVAGIGLVGLAVLVVASAVEALVAPALIRAMF
jgi:hypothetical protein